MIGFEATSNRHKLQATPSVRALASAGGEVDIRSVPRHGPTRPPRHGERINFAAINSAALTALPAVLARILPGGKSIGAEYVALNPRRADRNVGSFRVNIRNCRWADFANGDKGGDPISLVAYLADVSQGEAALALARMLGVDPRRTRRG